MLQALERAGLRYVVRTARSTRAFACRTGRSSLEAASELIERFDVVAIPGVAFGASFEGWLRLSWVAPIDDVREGIARIARFMSV